MKKVHARVHVMEVSNWVEGRTEKAFGHGTKVVGKARHKIRSYRCTDYGFLESYARGF